MRKISIIILFVIIILTLFCKSTAAQENPFMQMAGKPYAEYSKDLWDEYRKLHSLDTVEIRKRVDLIKEVAVKTGSKTWELEAEYVEIAFLSHRVSPIENEEWIRMLFGLLEKVKEANILPLELKIRYDIIYFSWFVTKNYEFFFEQCTLFSKVLTGISSEDIPEKANNYVEIANGYLAFKDYQKAICFFEMILKEPDTYLNQWAKQHARIGLGITSATFDNLDRSDSCFTAMMQVDEFYFDEQWRRLWNGIAQGNLASNMIQRGEYDAAIPVLKSSIENVLQQNDYSFASGSAAKLADIYLRKGDISEAKKYIDMAMNYNNKIPNTKRLSKIYEVLNKYYAARGNTKLSMAYMDSTLQINKQLEEQYSSMVLFRMEQKESAQQQQELAREKEIRKLVQIRLLIISSGFVVISILSFFLLMLYRKKRSAYLGLYQQIKEQDRLEDELEEMTKQYEQISLSIPFSDDEYAAKNTNIKLPGNKEQRKLVSRLREHLLKDNYFATFDIDIQELISEMATNRAYFFRALKTVTGKTPMEFINNLRLDEALKLLDNTNLTIEAIASECGFNTVRTFYRQFRDRYHITPAEYRNIAENQPADRH